MATMKDQARAKGREIRRETGIPLPLAMLAGKRIVRFRVNDIMNDLRFAAFVSRRALCGDVSCCGTIPVLTGPKGSIEL